MNKKRKKTGLKKQLPYTKKNEKYIIDTYNQLSEKDKRIYVAVEALKLPYGGQSYISKILNCSRTTIARGIKELQAPEILEPIRLRKMGGGRKSSIDIIENIDQVFFKVIDDYVAGDPMNGNIRWTNLSQKSIAERMRNHGIDVSATVIQKLLKKHNFAKRKALKKSHRLIKASK